MMHDLWAGRYREPKYWRETAEALIAASDLAAAMRVLDVGSAGGGTLFPALDRIGATGSIVGVEIDGDWVQWLNAEIDRRGIQNAENLLMDARFLGFPNADFDAVILGMVGLDEDYDFETGEILDDAPVVREVCRVLKPGGFLRSSGWLRQEDTEWMRELVQRHIPKCNKRSYFPMTEDAYIHLLQTVGFEDIRVAPFEGVYTYEDAAEWMACVGHVWEAELVEIKADADMLEAFELDAHALLAGHTDSSGRIEYQRTAFLIRAQKPML